MANVHVLNHYDSPKTSDRCVCTQLFKMSMDPRFIELAADVVRMIISHVERATAMLGAVCFNDTPLQHFTRREQVGGD